MKIRQVVFLNKEGDIIEKFNKGQKKRNYSSSEIYPLVVENYIWDKKKQLTSAEKYKDQIKRVYYKEKVDEETKNMLQDDIRRLELVKQFEYGENVLEAGCSDGTVSLKIAELPQVKKVLGIDIRKSAIEDGKNLIKDLLKRKEISKQVIKKVTLINCATEDLSENYGKFDSVCAYEIFEHLAPQDLMPVFKHLLPFIKKNGNFFLSVPNRFPSKKYEKNKRSRWRWFDHRNFFSQVGLSLFLSNFFKEVNFFSLYEDEKPEDSIYLICECKKKYEN